MDRRLSKLERRPSYAEFALRSSRWARSQATELQSRRIEKEQRRGTTEARGVFWIDGDKKERLAFQFFAKLRSALSPKKNTKKCALRIFENFQKTRETRKPRNCDCAITQKFSAVFGGAIVVEKFALRIYVRPNSKQSRSYHTQSSSYLTSIIIQTGFTTCKYPWW